MSVFVDTSALYALLVANEEGHEQLSAILEDLLEAGRVLRSTNYVLIEASALLQSRFGLQAVRDIETRIVPLLEVRWIDEGLHQRSVERLFREDRRRLSLVDCSSFIVMEEEGIREALALDTDFEDHGFRLLPGGEGGS